MGWRRGRVGPGDGDAELLEQGDLRSEQAVLLGAPPDGAAEFAIGIELADLEQVVWRADVQAGLKLAAGARVAAGGLAGLRIRRGGVLWVVLGAAADAAAEIGFSEPAGADNEDQVGIFAAGGELVAAPVLKRGFDIGDGLSVGAEQAGVELVAFDGLDVDIAGVGEDFGDLGLFGFLLSGQGDGKQGEDEKSC